MTLKKYVIERDIPGIEQATAEALKDAAKTSNAALAQVGGDKVQWLESFVVKDKTFCIYLAENEDAIREHARISGFPANRITEVAAAIGPQTAG